MAKIPCPYVYARGKRCTGHVVRVEAYKVDINWTFDEPNDRWKLGYGEPRSHYHVFCSEKSNHAGFRGEDALKFYFRDLPDKLQLAIGGKH